MRAARALLGIDQRTLAQLAGVSLPTIQRMEASTGNVRGIIDSLSKVIAAIEVAGVELIGEHSASPAGGRGVRLKAGDDACSLPWGPGRTGERRGGTKGASTFEFQGATAR